jgi:hypothetical protein
MFICTEPCDGGGPPPRPRLKRNPFGSREPTGHEKGEKKDMSWKTFGALSLSLMAVACDPHKLTREKCKELISTAATTATHPRWDAMADNGAEAQNCLERVGVWAPYDRLTREGGNYLEKDINGRGIDFIKPIPKVLDVTGISGGGGTNAEATFTWMYREEDMPAKLASCLKKLRSQSEGRAHLRRYDDGWRVEGIDWTY